MTPSPALVLLLLAGACASDGTHCNKPCPDATTPWIEIGAAPTSGLVNATVTVWFDGKDASSPVPIVENAFYDETVLLWNVNVRARPSDTNPNIVLVEAKIDFTYAHNDSDTYKTQVERADGVVLQTRTWLGTYAHYQGCLDVCTTMMLEQQ